MANFRVPGPQGLQALEVPIDAGTLNRGASASMRVLGTAPVAGSAMHSALGGVNALDRPRPMSAPKVPVLRSGSRGDDVLKLQQLLNVRLSPSPGLKVSGHFDAPTLTAVRLVQKLAGIEVDGVAGKDVWRVLANGKVYAAAGTSVPAAASPTARAPAAGNGPPATPPVITWTLEAKFSAMVGKAINLLPGAMRDELLGMISPMAIAITLAFWAASHFVGAGEIIDLALLTAGFYLIGRAIVGVVEETAHCLVLTHNAGSEKELDQAAAMLAHVISVVGVTTLVALLAKIKLGRNAGGKPPAGSVAAKAEAEAAAGQGGKGGAGGGKGSAAAAEEGAAGSKASKDPADTCGSQCSKAGEPVSMVSGEEMLELVDFEFPGPLALPWRRFYRSGQSRRDGLLGHGWLTPLDEWLEVGADVTYHNADGQRVKLPLPDGDLPSLNLPEKLRLYREPGGWRLVPDSGPQRFFAGRSGRCQLTRWLNPAGQHITLQRNAAGQVGALVANWGRSLVLQHDAAGRITALSLGRPGADGALEPAGAPHVRYRYSPEGDLVATQDRLDQGERYAYRHHLLVQRTLPGGMNFHFEWDGSDASARCLRSVGDGGVYDYRFEWLPGGVSRAIDSRGGVTEYQHNAQGLLLRQRSPEGRETRYSYNDFNQLHTVTDPAGQVTRLEHDAHGHLARVTGPDGHSFTLQSSPDGLPLVLTDPLKRRWLRRFDSHGRLTELRDPTGAATRWTYNAQGLPATVTDALGRTRSLLWDEHMRLVGETGFDVQRRRYQYDDEDRIVGAVTQDRLTLRYEYDAAGRVSAVHQPGDTDGAAPRTTRWRRDAAGRVTHFTDAAGHTTEYRYDSGLPEPAARVDPLGQLTRYEYDLERNLVALVNPKGERHTLTWDRDELLVEEAGFDGRVQRYEYDRAGHLGAHLQRVTGADGQSAWRRTRFERDSAGRLLKKWFHDQTSASYSHDAAGQLVAASNEAGSLKMARDALGRVLRETQNGQTVSFGYDLLGRRTQLRTPQGLRIGYQWNHLGQLAAIDLDGQPLTGHQYDELGREVRRSQGALESQFDYDLQGRLRAQRTQRHDVAAQGATSAPVLGRRYAYDPAGRVAEIDDFRAGASRYVYDPADRLLQVQGLRPEHFVHDPAGNLLGQAEGDAPMAGRVEGNRLRMLGDCHFDYDDAGNLVQQRRGKGGEQVTRYAYDADNRLVRAETPRQTLQFSYDALGRRVAKRSAQGETRFVYAGAVLLAETWRDATGERRRTYVFEPQGFRPLAMVDERIAEAAANDEGKTDSTSPAAQRAVYHYHLDHLGTPREMTDLQGRIVWAPKFRAYGALALAEDWEVENPLRFQGQYHDAETGLHYNLHRYYSPETGRFINQDPIGLEGGDNAYRYVPNPVNWVDPLGLMAKGHGNEPTLPDKQIASGDGVKVEHYYKSGDHPPAHAHVVGGGETTRIGANGKPLAGDPELTTKQRAVVEENLSDIRRAINKIGKWLQFNEGQ